MIDKLNKGVNAALDNSNLKDRLAELGMTARPGSSVDFGTLITKDTEMWAKVVASAGIKAD